MELEHGGTLTGCVGTLGRGLARIKRWTDEDAISAEYGSDWRTFW